MLFRNSTENLKSFFKSPTLFRFALLFSNLQKKMSNKEKKLDFVCKKGQKTISWFGNIFWPRVFWYLRFQQVSMQPEMFANFQILLFELITRFSHRSYILKTFSVLFNISYCGLLKFWGKESYTKTFLIKSLKNFVTKHFSLLLFQRWFSFIFKLPNMKFLN